MGELDVNSMTKVLHNKIIASALDEMRRKTPQLAEEETEGRLMSKSAKKKSSMT